MEIIQSAECFKRINGKLQFHHIEGILWDGGSHYLAKWDDRRNIPTDLSTLRHVELLDTNRGPSLQDSWTVAEPSESYYLKTPTLYDYASKDLEKLMHREIDTSEFIRQHPHPNLSAYHGCRVSDGRATGLYLDRYQATLMQTANPQGLNKHDFTKSDRGHVTDEIKSGLASLHDGIRHLHSLGLVHNDVNPSNIMLDEEGRLVLIDFDSCRHVGESILETATKRTPQWHDPAVEDSTEENDFAAFEELKTWLTGSAESFRFC